MTEIKDLTARQVYCENVGVHLVCNECLTQFFIGINDIPRRHKEIVCKMCEYKGTACNMSINKITYMPWRAINPGDIYKQLLLIQSSIDRIIREWPENDC